MDVVTLPVVADLDDFAENLNSLCLFAIKMASVAKVIYLNWCYWLVSPCCVLDYQVLQFSVCLPFFHIDLVIKCREVGSYSSAVKEFAWRASVFFWCLIEVAEYVCVTLLFF